MSKNLEMVAEKLEPTEVIVSAKDLLVIGLAGTDIVSQVDEILEKKSLTEEQLRDIRARALGVTYKSIAMLPFKVRKILQDELD